MIIEFIELFEFIELIEFNEFTELLGLSTSIITTKEARYKQNVWSQRIH